MTSAQNGPPPLRKPARAPGSHAPKRAPTWRHPRFHEIARTPTWRRYPRSHETARTPTWRRYLAASLCAAAIAACNSRTEPPAGPSGQPQTASSTHAGSHSPHAGAGTGHSHNAGDHARPTPHSPHAGTGTSGHLPQPAAPHPAATPHPPAAAAGAAGTSLLTDSFDGSGPLLGYVTNNAAALPDVARIAGRYRANLLDNKADRTLHYNQAQGRLDAKLVSFPFDVVARNIGIGTQADSQVPPRPKREAYIFAGIQVHVRDLQARDSAHVVVGHRGGTRFTVEGKNTVGGHSRQNDAGAGVVPLGRADLRVVGNADRTLTVYWQPPNPAPGKQPDNWTRYNGGGQLPGPAPPFGQSVYVGLITYAYGYAGVPFVGTCDALEHLRIQ